MGTSTQRFATSWRRRPLISWPMCTQTEISYLSLVPVAISIVLHGMIKKLTFTDGRARPGRSGNPPAAAGLRRLTAETSTAGTAAMGKLEGGGCLGTFSARPAARPWCGRRRPAVPHGGPGDGGVAHVGAGGGGAGRLEQGLA